MKNIVLIIFTITIINQSLSGQQVESEKILKEGRFLYRLERASWYGTDCFLEKFPEKTDNIGGYISYETQNHLINTIFYSKQNHFQIIARYQFDSLPLNIPISTDTSNVDATLLEKDLITIREDALTRVRSNNDSFFKTYQNTSFNLIPIIDAEGKKVIILTGPRSGDIVILGNDYLLKYDKNNYFISEERLHNTLIQLPYKSKELENKTTSTIHSHVVTDYITPTDVCTLLLYRDFVEWKQHYVISSKYVSIFDMEKEELVFITTKAWKRIYNSQEKNN